MCVQIHACAHVCACVCACMRVCTCVCMYHSDAWILPTLSLLALFWLLSCELGWGSHSSWILPSTTHKSMELPTLGKLHSSHLGILSLQSRAGGRRVYGYVSSLTSPSQAMISPQTPFSDLFCTCHSWIFWHLSWPNWFWHLKRSNDGGIYWRLWCHSVKAIEQDSVEHVEEGGIYPLALHLPLVCSSVYRAPNFDQGFLTWTPQVPKRSMDRTEGGSMSLDRKKNHIWIFISL